MSLGAAARIVVTTFDPEGQGTSSAEFVVPLGEDTVGIWTPHSTPWVSRLAHSAVVSIQAASATGRALRTEPVFEGRAHLVTDETPVKDAEKVTREKYGFAAGLAKVVDRAWEVGGQRSPDGVVIIHIVG